MVKIGMAGYDEPNSNVVSLAAFTRLQSNGVPSYGTEHPPGECMPCHFFHSPKTCRASVMCEYCHDKDHFGNLSRRLRKLRPRNRISVTR
jgi:hypothetical protein